MDNKEENDGILDMGKMKKHISWDEQTIAEHDKERGSRMIINEPKTPYNRLGIEENPEKEVKDEREELLKRLTELNNSFKEKKGAHVGFADNAIDSSASSKDGDYESKHKAFIQKRKLHYNEYQEVLKMRERMKREEVDNECCN